MEVGSIISVAIQQSDGKLKMRPSLLLKKIPPFDDYLVCAISSKKRHFVENLDLLIDESHSDFSDSGLEISSLIRVGKLFTIPNQFVAGQIGYLSKKTYHSALKNLIKFIKEA